MTPQEYEAKRQARYERLLAAAVRAEGQSTAMTEQARTMADAIPLGQPILVGHHSERADRNYRARYQNKYRRGYELHLKAEALRRRAASAADNRAIFSDDPAATEKLADKIARLERRQALMVAANKRVRKGDRAGLAELGFSDSQIEQLLTPDYCGRLGFPDYATTNNSANIRHLKKRLGELEAMANDETTERTLRGITIVDSVETNRLQIFFPGKPSDAARADLRSHGFRWAPTEGAWQRHRSNAATHAAEQIIQKHFAPGEALSA